jgi:predicted nucleic acid-binding protein
MKPRVYVETTVLGYLTSWPSGDLVVAGRQKITRDWWRRALNTFDLIVSELVHREASAGDPQAIRDRLEVLKDLPVLAVSQRAEDLAQALVAGGAVPSAEPEDALHIALAVVNGIEYLVTWNFKHIANAAMRWKIHGVCVEEGFDPCTICTPEELLEPESDV